VGIQHSRTNWPLMILSCLELVHYGPQLVTEVKAWWSDNWM